MQQMKCIKYRCEMNSLTCLAKQRMAGGKQGFGAEASDPGCVNCWQGKLTKLFVKFFDRNKYVIQDEELFGDVDNEDIAYG